MWALAWGFDVSEDDNDAALAQVQLEQQEQQMSLYNRLAEIQAELEAPKGQFNKFGGYAYRSCEDILAAVKPLLKGLSLTISDEIIMLGDRFYVKATATLTDGRERIESTAYAREALTKKGMDDSQITGSTSSYARKYALNGLLLIDDAKDADATNDHGKGEQKSRVIKPTDGAFDGLTAEETATAKRVADAIKEHFASDNEYGAYEEYTGVEDNHVRVAIWALLASESKIRATLKRMAAQEKETA